MDIAKARETKLFYDERMRHHRRFQISRSRAVLRQPGHEYVKTNSSRKNPDDLPRSDESRFLTNLERHQSYLFHIRDTLGRTIAGL